MEGVIYAIGGFIEQNKAPHSGCFAYSVDFDQWRDLPPLTSPRGAISVVARDGMVHLIGGRDARSLDTHEVLDPKSGKWERRAPVPGPRDHAGAVVLDGKIHVVGGRMDTFHFNTGLHVRYDPATDRWNELAPMPTPRSGHSAVVFQGKIFIMGGEGTRRVFGQTEAYDPQSDSWSAYTPMLTPRHGLGAGAIGNRIHVAGGGPMNGGVFQSSVHEAFEIG
jgi:N-acetylneuraminic acid mutarotase